jgi:hypothetical protein
MFRDGPIKTISPREPSESAAAATATGAHVLPLRCGLACFRRPLGPPGIPVAISGSLDGRPSSTNPVHGHPSTKTLNNTSGKRETTSTESSSTAVTRTPPARARLSKHTSLARGNKHDCLFAIGHESRRPIGRTFQVTPTCPTAHVVGTQVITRQGRRRRTRPASLRRTADPEDGHFDRRNRFESGMVFAVGHAARARAGTGLNERGIVVR